MEPVFGLAALGLAGYGAYALLREGLAAWKRRQPRPLRRRLPAVPRQSPQERRLNLLARRLQLALFDLPNAPDFRRAASWAAHAKDVPVAFRQRQFRRFRGKLLDHLIRRLRAGADAEALTQSLVDLLTQLGISSFEAEYLRSEAERRASSTPTPTDATYAQNLARAQREHTNRMSALRSLPDIDEETREQLLEAEETRFRQELMTPQPQQDFDGRQP